MRSQVKGETKGKHLILTLDNTPSLLYKRRADLFYLGSYSGREKEAKAVGENNYVYLFVNSKCSVCCSKRESVPRCQEQKEVTVSARKVNRLVERRARRQEVTADELLHNSTFTLQTFRLTFDLSSRFEGKGHQKNENVVIICTPTFLELHRIKVLQHSATAEGNIKGWTAPLSLWKNACDG